MKTASASIIIATFNSARILPKVLASIKKQTYPRNRIEILIVDGGSTDKTLTIAKTYHCRIIVNPNVEPLYAKYLGYMNAKNRYICYVDHDEVIVNPDSIKRKIRLLTEHSDIKAVIGNGYQSPPGYHVINRYINEFGEPFSFFMYRLSKDVDFFLSTMRKQYTLVTDAKDYMIFDLSASARAPIIELTAAGSIFDGNFFKKKFTQIRSHYHLIPHMLLLLRSDHPHFGIMKNDPIIHYSSDSVAGYMQKIIWRIKSNIFYTKTIGASGFLGRQRYEQSLYRLKKLLFIPYAFSVIFPAIDALYLVITRKDLAYSIHIPLTIITAMLILYYSILKVVGIKPSLTSYDGSTVAYEKN